ncbi:hypothetical protein CPA56_09380 [Bombella sp. TMW2.1889]|uniref:Uncharacterized protein n=1 Tax=Bombella mellum TaxID=2039288 RepID=A0ABR5ZV81_9PROT|nr:hypothetical protein [Bombella mellum]
MSKKRLFMLNSHSQKSRLWFFCRPVMGRQDPDGFQMAMICVWLNMEKPPGQKTAPVSGRAAF